MNLNGYFIEKMGNVDLQEVESIELSSSITPWSQDMFLKEILNPFSYCYVIKYKEDLKGFGLVGFICFQIVEDESELLNICVHPQYRHLGMGKKLMYFYIEFCKKSKVKSFYLDVNVNNQHAIHLYQLFSYQPVGRRKNYYHGKLDALTMKRKG